MDEIFGLPAHPLIVHGAVVLLPLAALATVIVAVWPKARRHYAPLALFFAIAATISVILAGGSGEALEERVDKSELLRDHTDAAEAVLPWSIALTAIAGAVVIVEPARRRLPKVSAKQATVALSVAAVITAAGATWAVTSVGHSGAKAAWDDVSAAGE